MTAQGPELRALADTLRWNQDQQGGRGLFLSPAEMAIIISALERAAAAEGEKAEAWAVAQDYERAWKTAGESADRFRDVVCEVLGLETNPGDDATLAALRQMHGKGGPEPRRWRDFLTGAVAHLEANGGRIGVPVDAAVCSVCGRRGLLFGRSCSECGAGTPNGDLS